MVDCIGFEIDDEICVIVMNNPPVNALGAQMRQELDRALDRAEAHPGVKAIVIAAEGRGFSAGADIKEFGRPAAAPSLPELCNRIEACSKPVVAAIHGMALGGGIELALAAHYRVAHGTAKVGLPEVTLGLIPGAGGTQRTPRLAGAVVALELMTDGRPLSARRASELGLLDYLVTPLGQEWPGPAQEVLSGAVAYAKQLVADGKGPRPTRQINDRMGDFMVYHAAVDTFREAAKDSHSMAPGKIADCVEAALLLPLDAAMQFERTAFEDCLASPASQGLRHAFLAERLAGKFGGVDGVQPRKIGEVGIVGGGLMGAGIAVACLDAGYGVTVAEKGVEAMEKAEDRIVAIYGRALGRKKLDEATLTDRLARLTMCDSLNPLAAADLIIEAIPEDMAAKADLFAALGRLAKPRTILASNTSYLNVDALARQSDRLADVIGLHFFAPAHRQKLLEVVVAEHTAPDVVATALSLAKRMGKVPVRSGVTDGFIGNRILTAYRTAADHLVEEGATPYQVDAAMRDFGFAMGPYQVLDMSGLDNSWARRKRLARDRDPSERYVAIGDMMCQAGWFGQKTARGYYVYSKAAPRGAESPDTLALIDSYRAERNITPREVDGKEIRHRCLLAMIAEGARLLDEGIAQRPSDIDVVMLLGFGFPRWRGGPMKQADMMGLLTLRNALLRLVPEAPQLWAPSPILNELIKNGQSFGDLNR